MSRKIAVILSVVGMVVALAPVARADAPQCISGGDGRMACGYRCITGGDGHAACSNVPWGACMTGGDGHAVCFQSHRRHPRDRAPAQCMTGGDGHAVCGYNCITGGDGHAVCASVPWGICRTGGDGHAICFQGS